MLLVFRNLVCFGLFYLIGCTNSGNSKIDLELSGAWRFHFGDSPEYAKSGFDDSNWSLVNTVDFTQSIFTDYNGIAWYRYAVVLPSDVLNNKDVQKLEFYFGRIDDCDQFYLNGHLIGTNNVIGDTTFLSSLSHNDVPRKYHIPINSEIIKWDEPNIIAVRVLDQFLDGGLKSKIYVRSSERAILSKQFFKEPWKFKIGDSSTYAGESYVETDWSNIKTGELWENQGFSNYDGMAWYRTKIFIPLALRKGIVMKGSRINFIVGKIDDTDQVFLNGYLIGQNNENVTSSKASSDNFKNHSTLAGINRVYNLDITDKRIKWDQDNVLAVRVHDSGGGGGIIGIQYFEIDYSHTDISVDINKLYKINNANVLDTFFVVHNRSKFDAFTGDLKIVASTRQDLNLLNRQSQIYLKPGDSIKVPVSLPMTKDQVNLELHVSDLKSSNVFYDQINIPFVLFK